MSRNLRIALIVSVVLNIFLVGAIAGGLWRWTRPAPTLALTRGWRLRAVEALPPEQGAALRRAVRDTVVAARPMMISGRASRLEAGQLFVAPTFDAPGTLAALDRARAADVTLRAQLEGQMVRFAATLPHDQRQALANALRQGPLRDPARDGLRRPAR